MLIASASRSKTFWLCTGLWASVRDEATLGKTLQTRAQMYCGLEFQCAKQVYTYGWRAQNKHAVSKRVVTIHAQAETSSQMRC